MQVDGQHVVPLLRRDVLDQRPRIDAGVLHEDVEAAEALQRRGDGRLGAGFFADIACDEGAGPSLAEPLRGRAAGVLLGVGDDDRRAFLDEALGDALADAARRADDDRDPVLQSVAHVFPSIIRDSAGGSTS